MQPHFDLIVGTSALSSNLFGERNVSGRRFPPIVFPSQIDWQRGTIASDDGKYNNASSSKENNNLGDGGGDNSGAASRRVLLVLGRESSGLTLDEHAVCDVLATIPGPETSSRAAAYAASAKGSSPSMSSSQVKALKGGGTTNGSLNVSHACAVLLYEIARADTYRLTAASAFAEETQTSQQQQQLQPSQQQQQQQKRRQEPEELTDAQKTLIWKAIAEISNRIVRCCFHLGSWVLLVQCCDVVAFGNASPVLLLLR